MEQPRFPRSIKEIQSKNIPLIYSKYYAGHYNSGLNKTDYNNSYVFDHVDNKAPIEDHLKTIGSDIMAAKKSSITSIMNVAAYMGAKNVILCGHDCGTINGDLYFNGYIEDDWVSAGNWGGINEWMGSIEIQSQKVRRYLMEKYNCNIHSLNPFLNLGLEENKFVKS